MNATPPSNTSENSDFVKVMLVDDSVVIRGALAKIIESQNGVKIVDSISNGEMAISSAKRHQPDIVILDIEMPVMDGLTALPKILQESPQSKVIMFSNLTEKGAHVSLKAISLGAVECLVKPSSGDGLSEGSPFQDRLMSLISTFAQGKALKVTQPDDGNFKPIQKEPPPLCDDSLSYKGKPKLLAIGSSTGGPNALFRVVSHFKGFDIPIVITQHMPPTFTNILAKHVEQHTGIPTFEGEEQMPIQPGHVYIAPGGHHMHLVDDKGSVVIHLDDSPPINYCKPAVDPMFQSAIKIYGNKVLGVILTGMGHDGLYGGKDLVEAGGRLIAQDEKTSVVWGMPGAVANAGLCSQILPLNEIGPWVCSAVKGQE